VPRIDDASLGYAPGLAHHDVGRDDGGCIAFAPLLPRLQAGLVGCLLLGFGVRAEGSEVFRLHGVTKRGMSVLRTWWEAHHSGATPSARGIAEIGPSHICHTSVEHRHDGRCGSKLRVLVTLPSRQKSPVSRQNLGIAANWHSRPLPNSCTAAKASANRPRAPLGRHAHGGSRTFLKRFALRT